MVVIFVFLVFLSVFAYLVYTKKAYYAFLVFAILYFICSSRIIQFDFATSVVPGWHTTIYPEYYFLERYTILAWLIIVTAAYRFIERRKINFDNRIFVLHAITTIPTLLYMIMPLNLLFTNPANISSSNDIINMYRVMYYISRGAFFLFIAGQIIFIIYAVRLIKIKGFREKK